MKLFRSTSVSSHDRSTISQPGCSSMSTLNYCSSMSQPSCFSMSSENCSSMSQPASSSISQHGSSFISPQNCSSLSQPDYSMSSQNCSSVSQNDYSSISSQYCSSISQPASSSISQPARSSISQPASPSISPQNFSSLSQPDYSSISYQNCSSISQTDYSSISPLSCSSVSQPACSSTSSQTCSSISQTDYSSTSPKTCSSISKSTLSSTSSQSCSSISQSTFSTTSPQTCSSISQSTFSPTLPHSCSSMSQPACSSISPQTCFSISQTERSSTSTQNCSSISQSTFSSISPQTCSSISQSTCSSTSPQTCSSISLTDYSSTSPQTCSSISQSTCSSTSPQTCSSISLLTCSSTSPQTSSSISLSTCSSTSPQSSSSISQSTCSSKSPQTGSSISQNHYSSILSVNCSSTPSQINTTAYCCDIPHNCRNFTSTNSNSMHSYTVTPDSTQDLQSQASIELDFVSYCAETSVPIFNDHSSLSGHQSSLLSTKPNTCPSVCNNSLTIGPSPTSIGLGPTSFSNTPPVPLSSCLSYPFHTVSTNIPPNDPETLSCCPHVFFTGSSPMYVSSPEEQKEAKQCEICKASVEHTVRMEQDRQLCEQFLDSLSRFEDWLQMAQIATTLPNPFKTIHREAKLALRKYEVLLREMREKLLDLESLNRQYWQLTQTSHQTLLPSVLRSRMQEVNMFWDHLQGETETIHQTLKSRVQQREEFDTDQEDMKLCLTEMDLELSSVEYIYGGNSTEKIQQLKVFQEDVWSNMKRVECLLERGDQLIDNSDPRDAETLEEEMTQLGSYCQEIFIRLSRLQKRLVSTKLVFEDDFLDGGLEHVSSGSSDVFLDLDIEDGEVPSPLNVPVANVALVVDLEWDPLGDVGRSSSHDGQESFYTATSAPWKIFQRSEGSQGSFSSDSGVTNSKLRSQVDPEPLGPQEQIDNQGVVETTSVPHNSLPEMETGRGEGTFSCSVSLPVDGLDSVPRMDNPHLAPGRCWVNPDKILPVTSSDARVIDSQSHHNVTGHRRRQGKRKRAVWTQDGKRKLQPAKQEVSILMENGDDMSHLKPYKTSSSSSSSLCLWMKRLATFSVLLLLLCGAFLIFPLGRSSCSSPRFTWSLMLTYVNGPPPT